MPVSDEHKLEDQNELLLRQVISEWVQEGRPVSRAFRPNSGDDGKLSCDRNSMVTPREAFEAYLEKQRKSAGVWALTVGEYLVEGLPSYSDPLDDNPAHAVVDYSAHNDSLRRSISKRLFAHALNRGRLYPMDQLA